MDYSNLTSVEIEEYERLLKWEYASSTLEGFVDMMFPEVYGTPYKWNFHHKIICEKLTEIMYSPTPRRVMIFVPPQHGKTEISSRMLPAWGLSQWPDLKFGVASYGGDIAAGFVRDTQKIIGNDLYRELFPDTRLASDVRNKKSQEVIVRDKQNANYFEVTGRRGSYYGVGVSGALTSKSLDVLIVDDLYRDMMQADSMAYRKQVSSWFPSVAKTRLSKRGHIIIVYTRWHIDDLAGILLEQQRTTDKADKWEVIRFPLIAEGTLHPEDPREDGQALWPEHRADDEEAQAIKATTPAREFSAIQQQRPTIAGGNMIKLEDLREFRNPPTRKDFSLIVADLRFGKKADEGSFVVFQHWLISDSKCYLTDQARGRWGYVETKRRFKKFCEKHPDAFLKYIEKKANGDAMEDDFSEIISGIKFYIPLGDKVSRVHYIEEFFEGNLVYLPAEAPWKQEYLDELSAFPQAPNDDQVDCTSMALSIVKEKRGKLEKAKRQASVSVEQFLRW